jgi:hypothetical protein
VSSIGRALPSLALIALGLTIFGFGFWNNTAALVVLAIPPILTNAYLAIDGVDRDVVEAARGMGLSERQVLLQVEVPLGLPLVIAGVRIAAVFVIATATIAAVAGGGRIGRDHRQPGELRARRGRGRVALRLGAGAARGRRARTRVPCADAWTGRRHVASKEGVLDRKGWIPMNRKHMRRAESAAFAIAMAVAIFLGGFVAVARGGAAAKPAVEALEAKGYKVTLKQYIGSSELIDTAFKSGKINFYPSTRACWSPRSRSSPSRRPRSQTGRQRRTSSQPSDTRRC